MALFSQMALDQAVNNCLVWLTKVSGELRLSSDPERSEKEKEFMEAVKSYDCSQVNRLLEEAIQKYSRHSDFLSGLSDYCSRYGLSVELYSMSERELIQFIAKHQSNIRKQLEV